MPKVQAGNSEALEQLAAVTLAYATHISEVNFRRHPPHRADFDHEDVAQTSTNNFLKAVRKPNGVGNYAGYLSQIIWNDFTRRQRHRHHEISENAIDERDGKRTWLETIAVDPHSVAGDIDDNERSQGVWHLITNDTCAPQLRGWTKYIAH